MVGLIRQVTAIFTGISNYPWKESWQVYQRYKSYDRIPGTEQILYWGSSGVRLYFVLYRMNITLILLASIVEAAPTSPAVKKSTCSKHYEQRTGNCEEQTSGVKYANRANPSDPGSVCRCTRAAGLCIDSNLCLSASQVILQVTEPPNTYLIY